MRREAPTYTRTVGLQALRRLGRCLQLHLRSERYVIHDTVRFLRYA